MNFIPLKFPQKVYFSICPVWSYFDEIRIRNNIILGIVLMGISLIVAAPFLQSTRVIYLPYNTKAERDYYARQIRKYNHLLLEIDHTAEDHLHLANALASIGEREAATQAYIRFMSHGSEPHTH